MEISFVLPQSPKQQAAAAGAAGAWKIFPNLCENGDLGFHFKFALHEKYIKWIDITCDSNSTSCTNNFTTV